MTMYYRLVLRYATMDAEVIEMETQWYRDRDRLDELIRKLAPFSNYRGEFYDYEVEAKENVTYENVEDGIR